MVLSVHRNVASHISGQMHFADRNIHELYEQCMTINFDETHILLEKAKTKESSVAWVGDDAPPNIK